MHCVNYKEESNSVYANCFIFMIATSKWFQTLCIMSPHGFLIKAFLQAGSFRVEEVKGRISFQY